MPWRRPLAVLAALGVAASIGVALPVVAADPAQPVRLTIAAPLTAPAGETGLITAEALTQYTSPLGLLTRQLDAMYGRTVAIGIDPMIIASIRVLGSSAPSSALAWLDRLSTAPNQVFPLAYADADLTLATQAGATTVPEPVSFSGLDPALFPGEPDGGSGNTTPTPTPTAAPDDGTPSLEEVLAWPYTVTTLAWPRQDTVAAGDLTALAASGYETIVLSSANLTRGASATPTTTIDGVTALVSDVAVSDAITAAAAALDETSWQAAMENVQTALGSAAAVQPGDRATVFATLDRSVPVVGSRLAETLDALELSGSVTSIPLTMAIGSVPDEAAIVDMPQAADRVVQTSVLLSADAEGARFARIAEDPDTVAGPRRLALLGILSSAWAANPSGWSTAVADYLQAGNALLASVRVEETSQVNFFASKSVIPIPITNDLAEAVTVYVTIDPDTPLLAVEDSRVEVIVPPNSQASAQVPVQAISNGKVTLTVELSSSDGTQIGPSRLVQVNVVAGWEGPVFTVLAVLVVAFFAFGIVRTILRRRKGITADD
jgi:hypothetical protein